MKTKLLAITSLLLGLGALRAGDARKPAAVDTQAAFARLKSLAGEWEAATAGMGKVRLTYRVIAGGTAVVERDQGENIPEMLTVYYMDGDRLLLTHFCMAGNQPRMEAAAYDPATGDLRFRFLDATNLTTPGAAHVHNGAFRFVDANHLNSDWQFYENGRLKKTESRQFTRVR